MATAPLRPCLEPGCSERVASGRCDEHRAQHARRIDRARGGATARGYNYRWHKRRSAFLVRFPLCGQRRPDALRDRLTECQRERRATPATVVDHLIAHKGDPELFWDERNWCASCATCNRLKAVQEEGRFGHA